MTPGSVVFRCLCDVDPVVGKYEEVGVIYP